MANETLSLSKCSEIQLLNELNKRLMLGKIISYHSTNHFHEDNEQIMLCLKNEDDDNAFFLYMSEGKMVSLITNFKDQMNKIHNGNYEEKNKKNSDFKILKYWDTEKDKSSSSEKMKTASRLLLSDHVRKSLFFFQSVENSDKITFRYYPKGEIRVNPDGSNPTYPDNSSADLKNDKFYESKEYDWTQIMSYLMMFVKGDERCQNIGKLIASVVSDIVTKIEEEVDNKK